MKQNRFQSPELKKRIFDSVNFSVFFFIIVMAAFLFGISMLSNSSVRDEQDILMRAINKDIVHCYAVEGFYPPSISYIEQHYGLTYDHDKYLIDYESIGNNIMPNVLIIERKSE